MYSVNKVRYFQNSRHMIGFETKIYRDGEVVGEAKHDGDCIVYDVRLNTNEEKLAFHRWAMSVKDKTIWGDSIKNDDSERSILETAGVEYLLEQYEAKMGVK